MGFIGRMFKWLLTLIVIGTVIGIFTNNKRQHIDERTTLLIHAHGPLTEKAAPDWEQLFEHETLPSLPALVTILKKAAHDQRISGVLLHVDSPEWGLAQVRELAPAFDILRTQGKWSIAYMDSGSEAGPSDLMMEVAMLADEIVMSPVGSIDLRGTAAHVPFIGNLLTRLKVDPYFDARKEFKSMPNTFTRSSMTPEQKQDLKQLVGDLQEELENNIASRRKIDINTVKKFYQQASLTAEEAKTAKLIDRTGYWDEVIDDIKLRTTVENVDLLDINGYAARIDDHNHEATHTMAFITAEGSIVTGNDDTGMADNVHAGVIQKALRDAREQKVSGVLLRVNSPGGSYVASDLMRREIELTRKAGIPVVVSMGNVAASGGYFIAMQSDHIFADPTTITGSIGVFSGTFATRRMLQDHLGVTFDSVQSTPKATAMGIDPLTPDEKADMAKSLDAIYADFVHKAAVGRRMTDEALEPLARGRVYTGRRAQSVGLVDTLGGISSAVAELKKRAKIPEDEVVNFTFFPEPPSPMALVREFLHPGSAQIFGPLFRAFTRDPMGMLQSKGALHMNPVWVTP